MTYLFCPNPDMNVRALAIGLGATLIRRFDGMYLWLKKTKVELRPEDEVICWGDTLPEMSGARILNSLLVPKDTGERLHHLRAVGVPCVNIVMDPSHPSPEKMKRNGYLARWSAIKGGDDLLKPEMMVGNADYFTSYLGFQDEFRVHSFNGKCIRIAQKVVRPGFNLTTAEDWKPDQGLAHPWIRSWNGGWQWAYGDAKSTQSVRKHAHQAIHYLQLAFGVVDVGKGNDNNYYVYGVGLAPDLPDQVSLDIYSRHLGNWIKGDPKIIEEVIEANPF